MTGLWGHERRVLILTKQGTLVKCETACARRRTTSGLSSSLEDFSGDW